MLTVVLAPRLVTTSPFVWWCSIGFLAATRALQRSESSASNRSSSASALGGTTFAGPKSIFCANSASSCAIITKAGTAAGGLVSVATGKHVVFSGQRCRAGRGPSATCSLVLQSLALLVLARQILCNHGLKVALRAAVGLSSRPHAAPQEQGPFHFLEFPPCFRFLAGGMPMTQQVFKLVEQAAGQCDIEPV